MREPSSHPALLSDEQLLRDCDVRRLRRSGPGGQHRNKVETAVALHHRPTGVKAEASERRSQAQNHSVALDRLRIELALGVRGDLSPDRPTSDLWRTRCPAGKIVVSRRHADFPVLLAEALDAVFGHEFDVPAAARGLGCSTSQLVRFLAGEPRALALVNDQREQRGLRGLRR